MYLGIFKNKQDIFQEFSYSYNSVDECFEDQDNINVLLASYDIDGYEGYAFVLFEHNGQLYEVHGSHCSCHGLEGQWDPEETSEEALRHRLDNGNLGSYYQGDFASNLREVLDKWGG
jgi:hypothetical protein